ncbi:hypothetical protein J2Z69_000945 [Paenibacillus shirakamiensis]|uniref:Copper amine oxidase-like N-terminal domain-containing protein n=2 Tax=Paenibacillus shirakamiensis TaxID=1265935 RepID=A0ABS4JDY3_9BACL|nr:hypothetical protein [Paenibacillus shirakamiensis]
MQTSVNGHMIQLKTPPFMVKGIMMVPLRLISEALGAEVAWNDKKRSIEIHTQIK